MLPVLPSADDGLTLVFVLTKFSNFSGQCLDQFVMWWVAPEFTIHASLFDPSDTIERTFILICPYSLCNRSIGPISSWCGMRTRSTRSSSPLGVLDAAKLLLQTIHCMIVTGAIPGLHNCREGTGPGTGPCRQGNSPAYRPLWLIRHTLRKHSVSRWVGPSKIHKVALHNLTASFGNFLTRALSIFTIVFWTRRQSWKFWLSSCSSL